MKVRAKKNVLFAMEQKKQYVKCAWEKENKIALHVKQREKLTTMNEHKKGIEWMRNDNARKFDFRTRKRGCLKFGRKQSKECYQKVFELCYDAYIKGEDFMTEAMIDSRRKEEQLWADFVNLDLGVIIEVANTETEKSLQRKAAIWKKYGFEMEVIRV